MVLRQATIATDTTTSVLCKSLKKLSNARSARCDWTIVGYNSEVLASKSQVTETIMNHNYLGQANMLDKTLLSVGILRTCSTCR